MNPLERHRRIEALFHAWFELDDASRRVRMDELARSEPDLHAELLALLAQSSGVAAREQALDGLADDARALTGAQATLPAQIGPFRILRQLGEGGMGRVFEGVQSQPVQRHAAVKLTRSGLDNERVIARFHAERQALAVLDHPNIARILDAGTHDDGRPWFAMELVDGVPITQWADAHALDLRQRIELLLPVCDAVQHAHRKGVIHRDLKPSNILVGEHDGKPVPKVIDFGIAKAIGAGSSEGASTRLGELIGTPEYMSPEQASLGRVDIDTRSDVYALGLVLFELLVGELPLSLEQLRRVAFDEMCRRIREDEPPRPSTRLANATSGLRGSLPSAEWARRVRGDLDAVVMKALAKDRERRYDSAAGLADDLRRFLGDQPVLAKPPHWRYRLHKWLQRNRLASAAAIVSLIALLVGALLATTGFIEARRSAAQAEQARQEAEATSEFLLQLFTAADPRAEPGKVPDARELLARGVARIDAAQGDAAMSTAVRARALQSLGDVSWALGDYDGAAKLLQQALDLHESRDAPDPRRIAFLLDRLGAIDRDRGDLAKAQGRHRRALAVLAAADLGESAEAARTMNNLAVVLRRSGDLDAAADLYAQVVALTTRIEPQPSERLAGAWLNLAAVHQARSDFEQAARYQQRALAMFRQLLPADHPDFAIVHTNIAVTERSRGDLRGALQATRAARANEAVNLPALHPDRADSMHSEAAVLLRLGQLDAAEALLLEARALLLRTLPPDSPRLAVYDDSLAEIRLLRGDGATAADTFDVLQARLQQVGQPAALRHRIGVLRKLALSRRALDDNPAAVAAAQASVAQAAQLERTDDEAIGTTLLALLALDRQAADEASAHFARALALAPACADSACALDQASTHVLRAHYLARSGQADAAFNALEHAVAHRMWNADLLDHADLASLRVDPRWTTMQGRLAQRVQEANAAPE